jgi:hypothetical protein
LLPLVVSAGRSPRRRPRKCDLPARKRGGHAGAVDRHPADPSAILTIMAIG